MTEYPLLKILVFIAMSFAPGDTNSITIDGPSITKSVLSHSESGWGEITSSDGATWKIDETSISRAEEKTDLSSFVTDIDKHKWSDLSILKLYGMTEVLKTSDGFWLYPNGIEYPENKYTITYSKSKTE
jgi:hypothetical protein